MGMRLVVCRRNRRERAIGTSVVIDWKDFPGSLTVRANLSANRCSTHDFIIAWFADSVATLPPSRPRKRLSRASLHRRANGMKAMSDVLR
jgi:hypothetical protein